DFPTSLLLSPDCADRLVIDLRLFGDRPVRLLRLRLDQLGDQLALLLGGKVAAVDVFADAKGDGVEVAPILKPNDGVVTKAATERHTGAVAVPAIEYLAFVKLNGFVQPVRLDIGDERIELLARHQGKEIGERMELENLIRGGRFRIFGSDRASQLIRLPGLTYGRCRGGARS